jgi:ketosteroid isomerase-like protein
MTDADALRAADRRRRDAMIAGDADTLAGLLAADLVWTHSSGRKDDRTAFLARIASGAADYHELEVSDDVVSSHGELFVHHGTLLGRVSVDGREKPLRNRFLSVWKRSADGRIELLAWQSTGF